jgi:hypothetical protein
MTASVLLNDCAKSPAGPAGFRAFADRIGLFKKSVADASDSVRIHNFKSSIQVDDGGDHLLRNWGSATGNPMKREWTRPPCATRNLLPWRAWF